MVSQFAEESGLILNWTKYLVECKVKFNALFNQKTARDPRQQYKIKEFEFSRTIGVGVFGRVVLARKLKDNLMCALKIIEKEEVVRCQSARNMIDQKKVLKAISFQFIVKYLFSFKDNSYLYIGMEFYKGGELLNYIRRKHHLNENTTKFCAAQIILALEYLHYMDLIYRDLKPENIVVDCDGYLKLVGFDFCKVLKDRRYTMCGTPEYLAPEVILQKGYGKPADYWSFGILIHEMAAGFCPFEDKDHMRMYHRIVAGSFKMPKHFSPDLQSLVGGILTVKIDRRLGGMKKGVDDIKDHKWFRNIPWMALLNKRLDSPLSVDCSDGQDTFGQYEETPLYFASKEEFKQEFLDF